MPTNGKVDEDKVEKGMGLTPKKDKGKPTPYQKGSIGSRHTPNPTKGMDLSSSKGKAGKVATGAEKTASGAKKTSAGATKAAAGATKASAGAARVAAGDLSGVGSTVKGIRETAKGLNETAKGLNEAKDGLKDTSDALKEDSPSGSSGTGVTDSLSRDIGSDLADAAVQKGSAGMKGLMSDHKKKSAVDKDKGDNDEDNDDDVETDDDEDKSKDKKSDGDKKDDPLQDVKDLKDHLKKGAVGASAAAGGTAAYSAMLLAQWLKMMLAKAMMLMANLWSIVAGAIMQVVGWIGAVTGLSAVWSAVVAIASTVATVITVIAVVVSSIAGPTSTAQRDALIGCLPSDTKVSQEAIDWVESGENNLIRTENISKAWSVFSGMGVSQTVAAGILGNFDHESGIDPTGVETIYSEKYAIGPKKAAAEAAGFDVMKIDSSYGSKFPGVKLVGIGFGQWSNGRNTTILNYAKSRGLKWYDIGTQLAFMFDGDNPSDIAVLKGIASTPNITISQATERFMSEWERPSSNALALDGRINSAAKIYLDLDVAKVDKKYAQSIISGMNKDIAIGNSNNAEFHKDNGCGETVGSHYQQSDGTGVFPTTVTGNMWSPATLPSELKAYTHDPSKLGLSYGSMGGWTENGNPGQCVALSDSYMPLLYPGTVKPGGVNGGQIAEVWAKKYSGSLGGSLSNTPQAGAVFQNNNSGQYGHTGVVEHVFANGDIIVVEQNIRGFSGDNNGTPNTWSWRYILKANYDDATVSDGTSNWRFYKPDQEPAWTGW